MRTAIVFAVMTLCATVASAQTPTAGERYKSVRVLTDMPATAIVPTMAFISNSLGVTCAHCHTDVYESDDKESGRLIFRPSSSDR